MREPTSEPGKYVRRYRTTARQLTDFSTAIDWYRSGVPVEDAIAWADLGYLPGEAASHIAAGRTPAEVAVTEAAEDTDEGNETRAALLEFATTEAAEIAAAGGLDQLIRYRIQMVDDPGDDGRPS